MWPMEHRSPGLGDVAWTQVGPKRRPVIVVKLESCRATVLPVTSKSRRPVNGVANVAVPADLQRYLPRTSYFWDSPITVPIFDLEVSGHLSYPTARIVARHSVLSRRDTDALLAASARPVEIGAAA